ncbi:MAG: RNA polymerase sigma factor [Phycisphaerales bacterium]
MDDAQPIGPADPGSATDEELLSAYVRGDHAALRELVERYQPDLLRFLTRLTGNREAAEDAFQDTFLQLHSSAARFDPSRRLKPWLFTIAANKARDALRKQRRQPSLTLSRPVAGEGSVQFVDLLQLETDAVDAGLEASERQAMVDRAIAKLSHPLREVLLLAYFQRFSYAQIADELGIPLGTVKSRLHAAVAQFAKHWMARHATANESNGGHGDGSA